MYFVCFLALLSHNNILFLSTSFDSLLDIVSQSRCTGLFWIIPFNPTDCQNFNPHFPIKAVGRCLSTCICIELTARMIQVLNSRYYLVL